MSKVLSSFSNTTRLKIISCLSRGEKNVTTLIANCGMSQSAVSQHLEKLRRNKMVTSRKDGKQVFYRLVYPKAAKLSMQLQQFAKEVQK